MALLSSSLSFPFIFAGTPSTTDSKLTFDLADIAKDERIIRAELQLYKLRSSNSTTKSAAFVRVDINDGSSGKTEAVRLLNSRSGGWKSFLLSETVKEWLENPNSNNGLRINIRPSSTYKMFSDFDSYERRPFLVIFTEKRGGITNAQPSNQQVKDSSGALIEKRSARSKRRHSPPPCKRRSMVVDTKTIGWDLYILAPQMFDAYRCDGKCTAYASKAVKRQTRHAVLQAVLAQLGTKSNGRKTPFPCCAPSQFESIELLLHRKVSGQSVISLEQFSDMIVKSCACL